VRTNPFYDAWLFLIGDTSDHQGSGVPYLLVAIFLAALVASVLVARCNWQRDPAQRTFEHLSTWFMRVMIGCMWFQGSLWKLPLPVSGGFQYWLEQEIPNAAFAWHSWIIQHVLAPNIALVNLPVFLTEFGMGLSYILGFLVRPFAVIGMLFTLQLWLGLYKHPGEWPWEYIFLVFVQGFFVVHNVGRSLGLDALLTREPVGPFAGDGRIARLYRKVA
jgi:uncharacterized membrane protein YphA (DoxX/SURF4 family)